MKLYQQVLFMHILNCPNMFHLFLQNLKLIFNLGLNGYTFCSDLFTSKR